MKRITVLASLALLAALSVPTLSEASVRNCYVSYQELGPKDAPTLNFGNMSVSDMTCSSALRAIDSGWLYRPGHRLGFHTTGYRCYTVSTFRSFRTVLGQKIGCAAGPRAFGFSWGP